MNFYVVTEGKVEKKVYKRWISYLNPQMVSVDDVRDVGSNNFVIFHSNGQPNFFDVCNNAIIDVNQLPGFDRLVLVADCEDKSPEDKKMEIEKSIRSCVPCKVSMYILIQNFCFETWALGNAQIHRKQVVDEALRSYRCHYDVKTQDPELLPPISPSANRAQFATKYLRAAIRDTYSEKKSYSKSHPDVLYPQSYFDQVKSRCNNKGHIQSFKGFIEAFS